MRRAAAALSWDGARVPARRLSARARAFLGAVTPARRLAAWIAEEKPLELRICWVPCLKGGPEVVVPPFETGNGKRIAFRLVRTVRLEDGLGAVYRNADCSGGL